MLEELRETVLTDLERRVERAIDMIELLRQDKFTLESQISELHEQIQQKDAQIESLENRNAELQYAESELKTLRVQREQEREDIDTEKMELRDRIEGVMKLLNGAEDGLETSLEHPTARDGEAITTTADVSFVEDESTETVESAVDDELTEVPEASMNPDALATEDIEPTAGDDQPINESSKLSFAEDEPTETVESAVDEELTEVPEASMNPDAPAAEEVEPSAGENEPRAESSALTCEGDESTVTSESPDEGSTEAPEPSLDTDTPVTEDAETETKGHAINSPWE